MKRLLLAGVLLAAAVGAPLEALQKYVAFGDSIMAGTTWPCVSPSQLPICPIIFDCVPGCSYSSSSSREQCSIPPRLEASLGAGNDVLNRGVAGEGTDDAVFRLPDELDLYCGAPGDCNAVLLMHGTNDMGEIGPESVVANLATMIGQARARNIDTVLMSIIRDYDPANATWQAYRDLVAALAVDEDLEFVDTHAALCPSAACRNANYFLAGASPCFYPDTLGTAHIDPEGYDVLAGLVEAKFPPSPPAVPGPLTPSGDIADVAPDFVWTEAATARWYELEVDGTSTWWEAAAHCMEGTCTVDPGLDLVQGAHSWRVRGRNLRGLGDWSAATAFTIWGVPGTPAGISPTGPFDDYDPLSPPYGWEPYTWTEVADATDYDLVVANGGGPVLELSFGAAVCVAATCSAAPGFGLAGDSYTWTVQGRNPATAGSASAPLGFDVVQLPIDPPTPTAPSGELFEMAPTYEWLETAGATAYDLQVKDSGGTIDAQASDLSAAAVCSAGRCSHVEPTQLTGPDTYTLEVRGRNASTVGGFSAPGLGFTVLACADPSPQELEDLQPSPVTGPAEVSHCGPVAAATMAPYTIEATGSLTVHTRDGFSAFNGFSVLGELTIRSP